MKMSNHRYAPAFLVVAATALAGMPPSASADIDIATSPLFAQVVYPPLNMLVMGKEHRLWYEAYNDASDLNGDGITDVGYKPDAVTYYGYFDSNRCYSYNGSFFTPVGITATKRCSGEWSGDFLNYLTTARIDALRKVLYGGSRSFDDDGATILERSFLPQDAHTWGKEYTSTLVDGYDISQYAPLGQPAAGTRHLFANVTTSVNGTISENVTEAPLLRVLQNSTFRIWNWVSIERAVAGNTCFTAANTPTSCLTGGATLQPYPGTPLDRAQMDTLETNYAIAANRFGSATSNAVSINCTGGNCNTFGRDDQYLTVMTGEIIVPAGRGGTYQFAVDGDDAIDFELFGGVGAPIVSLARYGDNAPLNVIPPPVAFQSPVVTLAGDTRYRFKMRHVENSGGDFFSVLWTKTDAPNNFGWRRIRREPDNGRGGLVGDTTVSFYDLTPPDIATSSSRTDYTVRVEVCKSASLKEDNCSEYPNGNLKPTGILHEYGEEDDMFFGLISGSHANNTEGGVLRKAVSSFRDEVDASTGKFTSTNGIVSTMDALRVVGFQYGTDNANSNDSSSFTHSYSGSNCPALGTRAIANGECTVWGNPVAEMMYESLRYFAGAQAATPAYSTGGSGVGQAQDLALNQPAATWNDPFDDFPACSKAFQTVISDINLSYDGGLPGNPFGETTPNGSTPAPISGLSTATQGNKIWAHEFGTGKSVFIGQSGAVSDGAPTAKSVSSFGDIRGLSPEEPTKGGSYYAASVGHFGITRDISDQPGDQRLQTFSVALASPLPRIEFPIPAGNGQPARTITLIPFAKSVGGAFGIDPNAAFQPTNTIVDFYVEDLVNLPGQPRDENINCDPLPAVPSCGTLDAGRGFASFRINYEDVEQGNDHDMDAIVRYELRLEADSTLTVNLTSEYAAGSVDHSIGYIISGTTADGIYLEVRDNEGSSDTNYYRLNTPPGVAPGQCAQPAGVRPAACDTVLPTVATRNFTPGTSSGAELLNDPLWYAAKYGGFRGFANAEPDGSEDDAPDGLPDGVEWDREDGMPAGTPGAGVPDNYFLVTNALTLADQLRSAFGEIEVRNVETNAVAVSGVRVDSGSLSFLPEFRVVDWTGDLRAVRVETDGRLGAEVWKASSELPAFGSRRIVAATASGFAISTPTIQAADFTTAGLGGAAAARTLLDLTQAELSARFGFPNTTAGADEGIAAAIDYLRGDSSREVRFTGGVFRNRPVSVMGDIVGSQPEVDAATDDFGYRRLGGSTASSYQTYLTSVRASRPSMVYVAANDGKLHGFRVRDGVEQFAFIPSTALLKQEALLNPGYVHEYVNDGSPTTGDAELGGSWRTVLVGTAGAGGRSVYALDVTDPANFVPSNVMWEFTNAQDPDIGTRIGTPVIALVGSGQWVAVFGNGYNSDSDDARLFIVDLQTGDLIRKFSLGDGDDTDPNAVGNVLVVDNNADGFNDTIYAATYQGEIWKVDVGDPSSFNWEVARSGAGVASPLFVAERAGVRQRITGGLDAVRGPTLVDGGGNNVSTTMLLFGSGRYFAEGDNIPSASAPIESFYGVLDDKETLGITRANLQEQQIISEVSGTPGRRELTQNQADFTTQRGWFVDLVVQSAGPPASGNGERFVGQPAAIGGGVFFITFIPQNDECNPGGVNWFFGLDALSGSPLLQGARFGGSDPCGSSAGCGALSTGETDAPPSQRPAFVVPPTSCVPGIDPGCPNLTGDPENPPPACDPRDPNCVPPCDPASDPSCRPVCDPDDAACIALFGGTGQCLLREIVQGFSVIRPCGRQVWRQMQ
jgi:type IV pilus assembly protein PilY1